jgi:hypothetical protein
MKNSQRINKIIKKFEKRLGPNPRSLEEIMDEEEKWRNEHPGLAILSDLYLRIIPLQYFLEGAKRISDSSELEKISSFILKFYDISELSAHNPFLEIKNEIDPPQILDKESHEKYIDQLKLEPSRSKSDIEKIKKDLKENMPSLTFKDINDIEGQVKVLEAKRMCIFATATLIAKVSKNTEKNEKKLADLKLRLVRFWSGFNKNFYKLINSDALGDLYFAVNETRKNISSKDNFQLSDLPRMLFLRYKNYKNGRYNSKLKKLEYTSIGNVTDEQEQNLSDDQIDPDLRELFIAMEKLLPSEKDAIKKSFKGEKLTSAERKAKSRARQHLSKILKR